MRGQWEANSRLRGKPVILSLKYLTFMLVSTNQELFSVVINQLILKTVKVMLCVIYPKTPVIIIYYSKLLLMQHMHKCFAAL